MLMYSIPVTSTTLPLPLPRCAAVSQQLVGVSRPTVRLMENKLDSNDA